MLRKPEEFVAVGPAAQHNQGRQEAPDPPPPQVSAGESSALWGYCSETKGRGRAAELTLISLIKPLPPLLTRGTTDIQRVFLFPLKKACRAGHRKTPPPCGPHLQLQVNTDEAVTW